MSRSSRMMFPFAVALAAAAIAVPARADDPTVEAQAFELAGARPADEVWTVRTTFHQSAQGTEFDAVVTESWRVTDLEDGISIAVTLTGFSFSAKAATGEEEGRTYGEEDVSKILDRKGNKIDFARTWKFETDRRWRPRGKVEGLGDTVRQLVDYAAHRLEADGAMPGWLDYVPEDLRQDLGRALRRFVARHATRAVLAVNAAVTKGLHRPFAAVLERLSTEPKLEPGAQVAVGPDAGKARYLGTTDQGERAHFRLGVMPEGAAPGVEQGARFAIDRNGRPRLLAVEQKVSGAMTGLPGGGEVRQSISIEVIEVRQP